MTETPKPPALPKPLHPGESHLTRALRQFHETYGHPTPTEPIDVTTTEAKKFLRFRHSLSAEEFGEYTRSLFGKKGEEILTKAIQEIYNLIPTEKMVIDKVELLDSLADQTVINAGTAVGAGISLDKALMEVHASNMSKLGTDGKPILREDGKILKGENYFPPNLEPLWEGKQTPHMEGWVETNNEK
jgi:hypothetical protein